MQRGQLRHRHRARFEQPSQIDRQIRQSGFHQDPRRRVVHVAQTLQDIGVGVGGRMLNQIAKVRIGVDAMGTHQRRGAEEQRFIGRVAANRRQQRELVQYFG